MNLIHRETCAKPTPALVSIFDALPDKTALWFYPRWFDRFACEQAGSGDLKRTMTLFAATNSHSARLLLPAPDRKLPSISSHWSGGFRPSFAALAARIAKTKKARMK